MHQFHFGAALLSSEILPLVSGASAYTEIVYRLAWEIDPDPDEFPAVPARSSDRELLDGAAERLHVGVPFQSGIAAAEQYVRDSRNLQEETVESDVEYVLYPCPASSGLASLAPAFPG